MKWVCALASGEVKLKLMRNPFNLQSNDAEFVEAAQTKRGRQNQITRLTIARSWAWASAILLMAFWMLMVALESFVFTAGNLTFLLFSVMNLVSGLHLDSQIKFLKVLEEISGE